MVESAARWVDRLFPMVPFRQWVLSLPFELRPRLAWDSDLLSAILRIFQAEVARQLGMLAAARGYIVVAHGAASVIQPFGSALNLNIHIHSLVPDGVWVAGPDGAPRWEPLRLADHDVLQVVARIASEVTTLLKKRGLLDDEGELTSTEVDEDQQLELALGQASARLRVATGERAGQEVRRRTLNERRREPKPRSRKAMQARVLGFDLEANVRIKAHDRWLLERVARYLLRPPLAMERLVLRDDGLYEYALRRAWSDGTLALVLSPMELMEKLAALVPRPRVHLVRYHGVFAANHR